MKSLSKWIYCLIFLLSGLLFLSGGLKAQDTQVMTLDQALEWGLMHSPTMEKFLTEINTLENKREQIAAELNWQVKLQTTTNYGTMQSLNPNPLDEPRGGLDVSLQGNKSFSWGLYLEPKISFQEKDLADFENLEDKVNFNLKLQQRLYPIVPNELEQRYYELEKDLTKSELNCQWQGVIKKIDWLEGYLNLIRLSAKAQLEGKNHQLAEDNLQTVLQQEVIGEAGPQQVLAAELSLKQAEIRLKQAENNFNQQKESWYQQLDISPEKEIVLTGNEPYVQEMRKLVDSSIAEFDDGEQLLAKVINVNPQVQANRLDQNMVQLQMEWDQKTASPQVSVNGDYDYQNDSWSVGANLSYSLYDGGQHALVVEDYHDQLLVLESNYRQLLTDLDLQLTNYLNQLEITQLTQEEKKLSVDKLTLEAQSLSKQLAKGLITEREWQQKDLNKELAEIDLRAATDGVLISKLRLIQFLGLFE